MNDIASAIWEKYHSPEVWTQNPEEIRNSGLLTYHSTPRPITDNWDSIVESALFLRGGFASHHSSMESLTEGSSLGTEDMDLVSNSSTPPPLTSYPSIKDSEDHNIYIFDGEQYVPISPVPQAMPISPLISSTNIPTPPAPQTLELPLVGDSVTTSASTFGIDVWNKPPDTLYYEKKTSEPDMWGYSDASSWSVHAHGPEPTLVPSSFYDSSPPPSHPAWCAQNGVPIVRHHFTINLREKLMTIH
jgi:hypothetical protein